MVLKPILWKYEQNGYKKGYKMQVQIKKETLDKERLEEEKLDALEFCCECQTRLVFWSETLQCHVHWEEEEIGCHIHPSVIVLLGSEYVANKKYAKDGTRLTDCCGAYSTFMEASGDMDIEWELTCKGCYETVPYGQGDGSETI
jgi:hypothetical protein